MIQLRKSSERGHADHGWLLAKHSFSFADYYDPSNMGFSALRVINEDRVHPGQGFGTHPHRDMEILTYVLEGQLEHKDSMGNGSVIRPGDVQYMSAGSGVLHSEFNPSAKEALRLLQIWIIPNVKNAPPRYGQKTFTVEERLGRLRLVASPDGAQDSIAIRQDAKLYAGLLDPKSTAELGLAKGRQAWVQVAAGSLDLNGRTLSQGDGAAISDETQLRFTGGAERAEFLVFDLP
jgi:redox-sensitive bicupin YhaK (pirin superfamily)